MLFRLAELTRRFHNGGFIHRDYYLSHFFAGDPADWVHHPSATGGETDNTLYLLDLQRVAGPGSFRSRWRIKDLASLAYSMGEVGIGRTNLLRCYLHCVERARLTDGDKRLIRRIASRVRFLQGRKPKYDYIWNQPGKRPAGV
jgi:heptose I phosphotransferase